MEKFVLDMELVHLAVELAGGEAMRVEVTRQFADQFPGYELHLKTSNLNVGDVGVPKLDIPGIDVVIKGND